MPTLERLLRSDRFYIILLIIFVLIYHAAIVVNNRLPFGFDAFQTLTLQYYFLNDTIYSGQTPQWLPFMTQGTVSTWWYVIQAGFLPNSLYLIAALLEKINFYYIFNASMLIDMLFLMAGTWLLGRRFLSHPGAAFFFCVSVLGSTIWLIQPWFNFHLFYCLPLILHLLHCFIDMAQWRYFMLGAGLMAMQSMGNLPYYVPMTTFIVFAYFAFFICFNGWGNLSRLRWHAGSWLSILAIVGIYAAIFTIITHSSGPLITYNSGRQHDNTNSLYGFLTWGGNDIPHKWLELIFGVSPELDYTLYSGILIVPMLLWTIFFGIRRKNAHILCLAILLLDLSMGGITAYILYYVWPLMKYYRHLGLLAPTIKIFILLFAAFAIDWFLRQSFNNPPPGERRDWRSLFPILSLGALTCLFIYVVSTPGTLPIKSLITNPFHDLKDFYKFYLPYIPYKCSFIFAFAPLFAFLFLLWHISKPSTRPLIMAAILSFHGMDVYKYLNTETSIRSCKVPYYKDYLRFTPMPFFPRRTTGKQWLKNPRSYLPYYTPAGDMYWTNNLYLFEASVDHDWRTEHWLKPLDQMMRAYWRQNINDTSIWPKGLQGRTCFIFPSKHPGARNFSALDKERIQIFKDVLYAPNEKTVAKMIASPAYLGNIPIILEPNHPLPPRSDLAIDSRRLIPIYIHDFSSNSIKLTVNLSSEDHAWLMFSDVWHPMWRATVNGKGVDVKRANLAYKAIPITRGINHVTFSFFSPLVNVLRIILSILSLLCIIGLFILLWRLLRRNSSSSSD